MKLLLKRVKRLHADVFPSERTKSNFNLNLNHLVSLEVLQINRLNIRKDGCLRLPNLLVLNVGSCGSHILKLETPKLFAFKSSSLQNFVFKFPATITHLSYGHHYTRQDLKTLRRFENLQCIYDRVRYCRNFDDYVKDSKLKEIHFLSLNPSSLNLFLTSGLQMTNKIKFFLNGIQIKEIDEVEELLAESEIQVTYWTQLFAMYYSKLSDRLPWVKKIDYSALANTMNEIPEDFYRKFCQISTVNVWGSQLTSCGLLGF